MIYDGEHFFDGFRADREYALAAFKAAADAGADWLVLCDTNGGSLPSFITEVVKAVRAHLPATPLGIHSHNDADMAVANALAAVEAGATQVQGTMNGWGERCGNANLISIIPALQLKMGRTLRPRGEPGPPDRAVPRRSARSPTSARGPTPPTSAPAPSPTRAAPTWRRWRS